MTEQTLQSLYESYLAEALRVEKARKPGEGIFGIGKKPSDDPCHDQFVSDLRLWLDRFRQSEPDSKDVLTVLRLIYFAPKEHPEPKSSFWMLIAVHGLTADLIPLLNRSDASALVKEYSAAYKRWERLPAQAQILSALKQAAK